MSYIGMSQVTHRNDSCHAYECHIWQMAERKRGLTRDLADLSYAPLSLVYFAFFVSKCVSVCCSVLQCVAVCCSVLQCAHPFDKHSSHSSHRIHLLFVSQCVAVCCSVLQCVHLFDKHSSHSSHRIHLLFVSQCVAVCCTVLQCVAVCTSLR